jgi:hypothetical protein
LALCCRFSVVVFESCVFGFAHGIISLVHVQVRVLTGGTLTPENVFTTVSLFALLQVGLRLRCDLCEGCICRGLCRVRAPGAGVVLTQFQDKVISRGACLFPQILVAVHSFSTSARSIVPLAPPHQSLGSCRKRAGCLCLAVVRVVVWQMSMTRLMPVGVTSLVDMIISTQRFGEFLVSSEATLLTGPASVASAAAEGSEATGGGVYVFVDRHTPACLRTPIACSIGADYFVPLLLVAPIQCCSAS